MTYISFSSKRSSHASKVLPVGPTQHQAYKSRIGSLAVVVYINIRYKKSKRYMNNCYDEYISGITVDSTAQCWQVYMVVLSNQTLIHLIKMLDG